jgi:putative DNA-invertase from lambdoid prophage Rac
VVVAGERRIHSHLAVPAGAKSSGHKKDLGFPDRRLQGRSADTSLNGRHPSGHESQTMKTVLYCRVSTVDQTLDHQRTQALQVGFSPDLMLADHGVSGISTRLRERPEGRRLFDILRGGDTLVVRWVDRLGRNYEDVTDTVRELIRRGIRIETVINRMTFDGTTTDPMQQAIRDSLVAFMAATAQANAEVTKEAQKAGIAYARSNDDGTKYRGRKPTFSCEQFVRVRELLDQGIGLSVISKTVGLKRQSVYRIRSEPEKQMAALRVWYSEDFAQAI